MPRFIAVHTLPFTEVQFLETMKEHAERLSELPPGVTYNLGYCGFADNKFFCDWEAPNKETMEQVFRNVEMPYDSIYPVKIFTLTKMGFED
jgi:hypothetical protein